MLYVQSPLAMYSWIVVANDRFSYTGFHNRCRSTLFQKGCRLWIFELCWFENRTLWSVALKSDALRSVALDSGTLRSVDLGLWCPDICFVEPWYTEFIIDAFALCFGRFARCFWCFALRFWSFHLWFWRVELCSTQRSTPKSSLSAEFICAEFIIDRVHSHRVQYLQSSMSSEFNIDRVHYRRVQYRQSSLLQSSISAEFIICRVQYLQSSKISRQALRKPVYSVRRWVRVASA